LVVLQGQRRALDLGDALLEDAAVAIRIEGVERATAAVFVKGTRTGSTVLVDHRYALTAQHVVGRQSPAGTQVELRFPAVGARVPALSVRIGEWATEMDVALLELSATYLREWRSPSGCRSPVPRTGSGSSAIRSASATSTESGYRPRLQG
jgi:hypothetical protein